MKLFLTLIFSLALVGTAEAQLFRRSSAPTQSCPGGKCMPAPAPEIAVGEPEFPTGVNRDALQEGYHINNVKSTRQDCISTLENTLPELNKKWRLVVVGTTDQRKEALSKIGTKDSVVINAFPPDHFYVKDMKPNTLLTLMRPDGEVVIDGGIADIDKIMDATKVGPFEPQPQPKPKPTPDPTPAPAPTPPTPDSGLGWLHGLCAGCGALLVVILRYGWPLIRNLLTSKVGSLAEHEIEALVNAKLAQMHLAPLPTEQGWK